MAAWRTDRSLLVPALVAVAAIGFPGCSSGEDSPASGAGRKAKVTRSDNPLAGRSLYVAPRGPAALQAARWEADGRRADAAAMRKLARRPTGTWLVEGADGEERVRSLTSGAAAGRKVALLVLYAIPGRDCGSFSAGGAASPAEYRSWVRAIARGIGSRRATVIVEPDAIAHTLTDCARGAGRRYGLLRFAVRTLAAQPNVAVYVDAGNAGWIHPASRLVKPLRKAGIAEADGFALNVSNFYGTSQTVRYGRSLSRRLGGKHFVIDTGRNGNGALPASGAGGLHWCNPPGRGLGRDPTTRTASRRVDAYLWVKQPGESDGACREGAPPAGEWWPEYALGLVRNRR